jgi:thiol-disulfide isomerase/thioredoxin
MMMRCVVLGLAVAVLAVPAAAESGVPAGNWKLLLPTEGGRMTLVAVVHLEESGKAGEWSAKMLGKGDEFKRVALDKVSVADNVLRGSLHLDNDTLQLEALVPREKDATMRGSIARRGNATPVEFEPTTITSMDPYELARETVSKQTAGYPVVRAALTLLAAANEKKAKPEEVRSWASRAVKGAEAFGPAWHRTVVLAVAELLAEQKPYAAIAVTYARQAERQMSETATPDQRKRVLDALAMALDAAGKTDEAKEVQERIKKIDFTIHPVPYPGRKEKGGRVVLVELFTGTQCPPCVAADIAFDALGERYKPSEVVRLEYHEHIPGPDPLTTPDSEARLEFYSRAVDGTPTVLFNGRPGAPGGGGVSDALEKYDEYVAIIDPQLQSRTDCTVKATAQRRGGKLSIQVDASAGEDAGNRLRVRCVLVEEEIDYKGPNGVAHHHHVVRSFPGGVEGEKLVAGKSVSKTLSVDLEDLRKQLKAYLDKRGDEKPFPGKVPALALEKLRVVAFVQNDANGEVLNAVQADVE